MASVFRTSWFFVEFIVFGSAKFFFKGCELLEALRTFSNLLDRGPRALSLILLCDWKFSHSNYPHSFTKMWPTTIYGSYSNSVK